LTVTFCDDGDQVMQKHSTKCDTAAQKNVIDLRRCLCC